MTKTWGISTLLLAASCIRPIGTSGEPAPSAPQTAAASTPEDLRDNPIAAAAAEPPWRDLVRHTTVSAPSRVTHPGPSRDGSRVCYASTEFGGRPRIVLRDSFGAAPTQITQNESDNLFPRISPDGKRVAYASNREGNFDIYVARLDAPQAVTRVTTDPEDEIAPSWSPDGKRLVYSARRQGDLWQVVIADVGSRVKTFLGPGLYPDWSPDANDPWICFQSQPREAGGRSAVWVVRPDGTSLRELSGDRARAWSAITPRFSPDGRWVAYATVHRSPESRAFGAPDEADDVWIVRPDGTLDTRLTDDVSAEWWPAWGGDRVFFISNRGGERNLWSVQVKPLEELEK